MRRLYRQDRKVSADLKMLWKQGMLVSKEIMKQTETILVYAGFMHDLEDFFNVFCFHIMIVPL